MSEMGLSGLETVVEPCLERSFYASNSMALPRIPSAIMEYKCCMCARFVGYEGDEVPASRTQNDKEGISAASPMPLRYRQAAAELINPGVPLYYSAGRLRVIIVPNTVNDEIHPRSLRYTHHP